MILKGNIEDVIFRNEENGYTVALIDCSGELITAVGKFSSANAGEVVELKGNYVKNNKYGEQFSATSVKILPPNTLEGIEKYLASGLIKGVGPVTAGRIVEKFKEDTLEVIEFNPAKLKEVNGISQSKAVKIAESFKEIKKMQNAVMFLLEYNLTTNMAVKIYQKYKDKTQEILDTNPYKLVEDIDGIGFLTADKIAIKLGMPFDSPFRIRAGVLHILKENSEKQGNTYLLVKDLDKNLKKLLQVSFESHKDLIDEVLNRLILDGAIKQFEVDEQLCLMLTKFYMMERDIAEKLVTLKENNTNENISLENEIKEFERTSKIKMHKAQKQAVETAFNNGVSVITGGPGTGKTTIVKCVLNTFKNAGKKVALLAPTGRAAKKLNESTGENASTIHRTLGVNFGNNSAFAYNELNKMPYDAIIVDEVSMVDVNLMYSLLKAIKKTAHLILVGDKNQLPSVGAGNVLADILTSKIIKVIELTKIYRQQAKSLIITNAHLINNGAMPKLDNTSKDFFFENKSDSNEVARTIVDLTANRIPKYLNIDPYLIQVLAPIRLGASGVDNLNTELQKILNPPSNKKIEIVTQKNTYRVGDKVMQIANNYNQEWTRELENKVVERSEGVFNGDIGVIEKIDKNTKELTVLFEDGRKAVYARGDINQLVLSYATTIHKSQGSEFDVVIIPVTGGPPSIITRNLLYTAVTRAKKMVILVGTKFSIKRMVENNYTKKRYSMLNFYLIEAQKNIDYLYGA